MPSLSVLPKPVKHKFDHSHHSASDYNAHNKKVEAMHLLYDGGNDHFGRKTIVFSACHLPNPNEFNYDFFLLTYLKGKLESYVEDDYAVIFFSSPAHYRPSWIWLLKAYRQLDHSFKKNLKALYVLHMSKSYQHVFNLANKIISPKFGDKVLYLAILDELDKIIDLAHVAIPHEVVEYELALPPTHCLRIITTTITTNRNREGPAGRFVFSRGLEDLAKVEGIDISNQNDVYIPTVVQRLVEQVRSIGLQREGIFRKSPSNADLSKARDDLDQDHDMHIEHLDVHTTASLLKMFLACLPWPLIPSEFVAMHSQNEDATDLGQKLRDHYKDKPHHFALLHYLVSFLAQVSEHSDCNKMTVHNLAIVFSPSLIRSTVAFSDILTSPADAAVYLGQMKLHMAFIEFLFQEKDAVFSTR